MKPSIDYTLYLVTDRELMRAASLEEAIESAVRGGCTVVQLREKSASSREFYDQARAAREITRRLRVPLIVNDRADIAAAVDAEGVHVGQSDLPVAAARRIVGPEKIVGVSVSTFEEAVAAAGEGADYLGVGAMFATDTKTDAVLTPLDELRRIRAAVSIPIVVIGGITLRTIPLFRGTGIEGIAVVSAVLAQPDSERAARNLRSAFSGIWRLPASHPC